MTDNSRVFLRGGQTFERITLKDTILGALLFWAAMLALRLAAVGYVVAWALVTGRGAGWIVLVLVILTLQDVRVDSVVPLSYSISFDSAKYLKHRRSYTVALLAGAALCALHLVDVWPAIHWEWGDGQAWWVAGRWSGALSPLWTWLRVIFIAGSAWVIWSPSLLLNWVLKTEQVYPKARETTYAQGDPESILDPHGRPYVRAARGQQPGIQVIPSGSAPQDAGSL